MWLIQQMKKESVKQELNLEILFFKDNFQEFLYLS